MDLQQVIEQMRHILKREHILEDAEDLYVYSYEKLFETQKLKLDVIVKTLTPESSQKILELAGREEFTVLKRGETEHCWRTETPVVLLDDIPPPELQKVSHERKLETEGFKDFNEEGFGSPRRLAFAVGALFSEKELEKCGQCKICSGYCTVASSYGGVETWSSKGRILLIRALQNQDLPLSKKIVDVMYTCTGCGLCFAQCFQGLEVNKAINAARRQIAMKGMAPRVFKETAKNVSETGSPGAVSVTHRHRWLEEFKYHSFPEKARVLYWVGCMVAGRTPRTASSFMKILLKANVDFTVLKEKEGCCGYVLLSTGLWDEAKKSASRVLANIAETEAEVVVTPCAGCYYAFTRLYHEALGIDISCEILHSSQFIETLVRNKRFDLKSVDLKVGYHDPCSLGRHCGVFEAPRNVLTMIPGLELNETGLCERFARCCGGGGGLWSFNHQVSMNSAHLRLQDFHPLNNEVLATACPLCQMNLRYSSFREANPLRICDVTEIVASASAD